VTVHFELLDRAPCRAELLARVVDGHECTIKKHTSLLVTLQELQPAISDLQLLLDLSAADLGCPKIKDTIRTKVSIVDARLAARGTSGVFNDRRRMYSAVAPIPLAD
jgi:hypothetical protein